MDELGGHLLARARLAGDEHGRIGRRHAVDQFQHARNDGLVADELAAEIRRRQAALEQARPAPQRLALQRALDAHLQFVERAGLRQIVERAEPDRLDGGVDRAVAGQHDHVAGRLPLADHLEHVQAAHVRQLQVEQHDVRLEPASAAIASAPDRGQRRPRRPRRCSSLAERAPVRVVVVDEQDEERRLHAVRVGRDAAAAGSTTSNVDPPPGVLVTAMSPPQWRTKFSDRNRPRPVPPVAQAEERLEDALLVLRRDAAPVRR